MTKAAGFHSPRLRGSTLIMVIGILAMLAVVVSTFLSVSRYNASAAVARGHAIRLDLLANGALTQVRTLLARDLEFQQEPFDHPRFDPWLSSVLTDFRALSGRYRYITRLDLADNEWNNGGGAGLGGRPPDNMPPVAVTDLARYNTWPTTPLAQFDSNADGVPDYMASGNLAQRYYVDADGDGRADSYLGPIGQGVSFPDGTCAYMAVRVVDNAHLNPLQHSKWTPWYGEKFTAWPNSVQDSTDGRVDWGWLPDPTQNGQLIPRPRLPHVSFKVFRSMSGQIFGQTFSLTQPATGLPTFTDSLGNRSGVIFSNGGGFKDNPDNAEVVAISSALTGVGLSPSYGNGWGWDQLPDRGLASDRYYYQYEPGYNIYYPDEVSFQAMLGGAFTPRAGTGLPFPTGSVPNPTNALNDGIALGTVPFRTEDDLALRTWVTDPRISKYAAVYPTVFGMSNLRPPSGSPVVFSGGDAPIGIPAAANLFYEQNFMRVCSSITRERIQRWTTTPGGIANETRFDLKRLMPFSGAYVGGGAPSGELLAKLNLLASYMALPQYNILGTPGLAANSPTPTVFPTQRRAQFLANLCEYIRPAPVDHLYVPTIYEINGGGAVHRVYGFCKQPFITEFIRDTGLMAPVPPSAPRVFNTVRVGVELFNPFPTPLRLTNYTVEFEPVAQPGLNVAVTPGMGPVTLDFSSPNTPQVLPPFGYLWIATDNATNVTTGLSQRYAMTPAQAADIQRMGPRLVVRLRAVTVAGANNPAEQPVILDVMDTRSTPGLTYPPVAGRHNNVGYSALGGGEVVTNSMGFSDWDGTGAPNPGAIQAMMNTPGFVNNTGAPLLWETNPTLTALRRSGCYRPMVQQFTSVGAWGIPVDYYTAVSSQSSFMTALTMAHGWQRSSNLNSATNLGYFTPGQRNRGQQPIIKTSAPIATFNNRVILGTPLFLPNRGVDPMFGCRFMNLGELAHVLTVGHTQEFCLTQIMATASELSVNTPEVAPSAGTIASGTFTRPYTYTERPQAHPLSVGYDTPNRWYHINFDRRIKFDIYEGARLDGITRMPVAPNARILDLLSLYMGNGSQANTITDFQPWAGPVEDTSHDWTPTSAAWMRAAYREGRINFNTAPWIVLRCIPTPQHWHNKGFIISDTPRYADGAQAGMSVYFAECLAGTLPGQEGYMNRILPNGRDPYFANTSDIFLFAESANPDITGRYFANLGMGWDATLVNPVAGNSALKILGGFAPYDGPWKGSRYKHSPHASAYQYPRNRILQHPNVSDQLEYPDHGQGVLMSDRDDTWPLSTNVASVRSDVYTVYILVKLLRPTPGVIQPETGQPFQDLGECRLVAIVDRTNCVLTPAGGVSLAALPRILGQIQLEN